MKRINENKKGILKILFLPHPTFNQKKEY